ncbi:sulfurtransferase [Paenibacillus sp. 481]|uniref:sulfurtransferase n=1 Tax=Paenibacillus sp. 481 TaxID=2835869 RepID=UPI001E453BD4|nr:sulfurtransferase [Paenibacillus sp. 481]UHA75270.1 sulfurtransferase [Paenibacillus sp. 481]
MAQRTWIIGMEEVKELILNRENDFVLADCRFWLGEPARGQQAFEEGHIEGAVYFDLDRDLSSSRAEHGGRHPLPQPEALAVTLGERGIGRDTTVIAYDDQGGAMASRLWWLLQYMGHDGEVYIMDGGFSEWAQLGYPVTAEQTVVQVRVRRYEPQIREELVVHMDEVRESLGREGVVLIDSREKPRYLGEMEPIDPVAGHIPGAKNEFWRNGFDDSGRWFAPEAQAERWRAVLDGTGLKSEGQDIIVYCGSGVTACPNVLALWQAGYTDAKLYAGSWSDWVSYKENPVATGEE